MITSLDLSFYFLIYFFGWKRREESRSPATNLLSEFTNLNDHTSFSVALASANLPPKHTLKTLPAQVKCYKNGEQFQMERGWHKQCLWNSTTNKVSILVICATDTDTGYYQVISNKLSEIFSCVSQLSVLVFIDSSNHHRFFHYWNHHFVCIRILPTCRKLSNQKIECGIFGEVSQI